MLPDLDAPPPRAVCEVAAKLSAAAKNDDTARAAALLAAIRGEHDMTALVMLLARSADRRRLMAETGFVADGTPRELHADYVRLRSRGVPHSDIAPYIRAGESAYQRQVRIARGEIKNDDKETPNAA